MVTSNKIQILEDYRVLHCTLNTNANERNHAQTRAAGLAENTGYTICLYELS